MIVVQRVETVKYVITLDAGEAADLSAALESFRMYTHHQGSYADRLAGKLLELLKPRATGEAPTT